MRNVNYQTLKKTVVALSISLIYFTTLAYCDLPIQCVKHQIYGQWKIQMSKGSTNPNGFVRCGHHLPDKPNTSYQAYVKSFKKKKEILVDLRENGEAFLINHSKSYQGSWTMMYDEGFSMEIANTSYLVYFKYYPIKEEEVTEEVTLDDVSVTTRSKVTTYEYDCTETIVGWYTNYDKNVKGCMKAQKMHPKEEDKHLVSESKGNVVQPVDIDINNFTEQQENNGDVQDDIMFDQSTSTIQRKRKMYFSNTISDIIDSISSPDQEESVPNQERNISEKESVISYSEKMKGTNENEPKNPIQNESMHKSRVEQLNTLNKNWQAGISPSFKDLSLNEVNKKAGRTKRKSIKKKSKNSTTSPSNLKQQTEEELMYKHFSINDVSDLPRNFTWEEFIDKPIEQDDCGSCYIISTSQMLNARLKIKYGKDFNKKISMQHLLDCSFFSQGCEGGYPFELGRFGKDYFMIPEGDIKFKNEPNKCQINNFNQLDDYFKITDYGFVGKQYGKVNEREMMIEIMKNGPIVANFKTNADFVYYQSGVYHSVHAADWILKCEKQPEWRPVEHAVMCYGWGESEEDGKYWLMQNSWGEEWGEKGRFKIRRGTDESFIESSAEYAQVEYIQKII